MANSAFAVCLCLCFISAAFASQSFYEPFEESWEDRWIVSEKSEYTGKWKNDKSLGHEDYGLLVSEPARKYGIVAELPEPFQLEKSSVVLQYDLRLQNGLECGGAYLKFLLPQAAGWEAKQFDNESPYSIMFGPDKCGATNKVHFIFRHKNPKTGAYVEHHLKNPPAPITDKLTHVYTAVIYPDNKLKILIDGEEKKSVDLLSSDFEPPVIPDKTIADPDDVKPEDWDERAKIPDPDAKKPDDWDEDAPMEIEDMDAEKPEGWLDDEPEEVEDPEAAKPEDWDDEEDGEWEAPKIPNPRCEEAPGCGEWKRPTKKNPLYKGKWYPPMIDNPKYQGIWKPKQIPNPAYFELEHPNFEPIAAVGIEIWTMQDGILFDNVLITNSEEEAVNIRKTTWKVKFDDEKKEEKNAPSDDASAFSAFKKKIFSLMRNAVDAPFLSSYRPQLIELIEHGEKNPNVVLGILVALSLVFTYTLYKLLFGRTRLPQPDPVRRAKKEDITPADDKAESGKEKASEESKAESSKEKASEESKAESFGEIEGESSGARHRKSRRDT